MKDGSCPNGRVLTGASWPSLSAPTNKSEFSICFLSFSLSLPSRPQAKVSLQFHFLIFQALKWVHSHTFFTHCNCCYHDHFCYQSSVPSISIIDDLIIFKIVKTIFEHDQSDDWQTVWWRHWFWPWLRSCYSSSATFTFFILFFLPPFTFTFFLLWFFSLSYSNFICNVFDLFFLLLLIREVIKKKNGKKAVRLTAWVDPSPPSPEAVRKM